MGTLRGAADLGKSSLKKRARTYFGIGTKFLRICGGDALMSSFDTINYKRVYSTLICSLRSP